jgi:hypothetical protein
MTANFHKSRITIQCNQTNCKFNSEYTINNEHECTHSHPSIQRYENHPVICNTKELCTTLTTHGLLEIDEAKEIQKNVPWQCTHCITEDTEYCMNLCPIVKDIVAGMQ